MSKDKKKLYRERLNEVKEKLRELMLDPGLKEIGGTHDKSINPDVIDTWGFALLIDEATTLSRLTKWLIALTAILSAVTVVLAYPIISGFLAHL